MQRIKNLMKFHPLLIIFYKLYFFLFSFWNNYKTRINYLDENFFILFFQLCFLYKMVFFHLYPSTNLIFFPLSIYCFLYFYSIIVLQNHKVLQRSFFNDKIFTDTPHISLVSLPISENCSPIIDNSRSLHIIFASFLVTLKVHLPPFSFSESSFCFILFFLPTTVLFVHWICTSLNELFLLMVNQILLVMNYKNSKIPFLFVFFYLYCVKYSNFNQGIHFSPLIFF
jgi:hypothetical protein